MFLYKTKILALLLVMFLASCSSAHNRNRVTSPRAFTSFYADVNGEQRLFSPLALWFLTPEQRTEILACFSPDGKIVIDNIYLAKSFRLLREDNGMVCVQMLSGSAGQIWLKDGGMASLEPRLDKTVLGAEAIFNRPQADRPTFTPYIR